jgi:hypothetical protein
VKFFLPTDVDSIKPVQTLGSNLAVGSFGFILRDAHSFEVQFFSGRDNGAEAVQPHTDLEMVFSVKPVGLLESSSPVVLHSDWVYDEVKLSYIGKPSFRGLPLLAMFVGATSSRMEAASLNLALADVGTLIGCTHASTPIVVTIPSGDFGAANDYIDIVRGGAAGVSIVAGGVITLTSDAGVTLSALSKAQVIRLTRTAASTWRASLAPELDSITAVGEITWRSAAAPEDWSSAKFAVTVEADVYRGFEGDVERLSSASNYATVAALANKANSADVYTKTEIDAHTGNTGNPHNVTKTQLGIANVDNTSDANKPISTATQTALDGKQASLPDVVAAASYIFPCKVTVTAKGVITEIVASRRGALSTTVTASLSTAWLQGPSVDLTGMTLAVGDAFEMEMTGVVTNAAATTALNFGVSSGASTVSGPSLNLTSTAATNRQWFFRATAVVASFAAGDVIWRVGMIATVNPITAGTAPFTTVAYVASSAHSPGIMFPRVQVSINSASCSIHAGVIRQI